MPLPHVVEISISLTIFFLYLIEIENYAHSGDVAAFNQLKAIVNNPDSSSTPSPAAPHTLQGSAPVTSNHHSYTLSNGPVRPSASLATAMPQHSYGSGTLTMLP